MNLSEIESLTRRLAEARDELSAIVTRLQLKQASLTAEFLPQIKRAVAKAADRHALVYSGIEGNRGLFVDPKTQTFSGIRVGLMKGSGKIVFHDPEQTIIGRVEDKYSKAEAAKLVDTKKTLKKKGLSTLCDGDLQSLGCEREAKGDFVYIGDADDSVAKIVDSLLKSAVDEAQKEAAA